MTEAEQAPGDDGMDDVAGRMRVDGYARWTLPAVPPRPERVSYVRGQVAHVLQVWNLREVASTVELAVSELVTNVVRHARTPFTLVLTWDGHRLHGEVIDANPREPVQNPRPTTDDLGGRGLFMLGELVQRWGWCRYEQGKVVYFDVAPGTGTFASGH